MLEFIDANGSHRRGAAVVLGNGLTLAENADGLIVLNTQSGGAAGTISMGSGGPEGVVTASSGSLYIQQDSSGPYLWVKLSGTGNTGWSPANNRRSDVLFTTASLADQASADVSVTLGRAWTLWRIQTSVAARVRLYSTSAARTSDASRNTSTAPTANTGVLADVVTTSGAGLNVICSPPYVGANMDTPVSAVCYAAVQNRSGSTGTVTVTLTRTLLEI